MHMRFENRVGRGEDVVVNVYVVGGKELTGLVLRALASCGDIAGGCVVGLWLCCAAVLGRG